MELRAINRKAEVYYKTFNMDLFANSITTEMH